MVELNIYFIFFTIYIQNSFIMSIEAEEYFLAKWKGILIEVRYSNYRRFEVEQEMADMPLPDETVKIGERTKAARDYLFYKIAHTETLSVEERILQILCFFREKIIRFQWLKINGLDIPECYNLNYYQ